MMTFIATVAESTYVVKFVHINAIHTINKYAQYYRRYGTSPWLFKR